MPIDRDGDGPPLRRPESKVSLTPGEGRSTDLRATPFTEDVFNDDFDNRRARPSEGRSFSVIVGVVLGVVVAGGVGWYVFKGSGGLQFTPGTVGFVKADPTPYKIRPDSPGGMQVENQDKLVYDRVAKGQAPNRVENLLPPAEEPKAPPMKPAEPKVEAPAPAVEAPKVEAIAPEPAKPVEVAKAEPPKVEAPKVETPPPAPKPEPAKEEAKPAAPQPDPLAAAVAAATGGRTSATGPIAVTPEKPAPAEKPAEAQTAAAVPAPAVSGGGFQIQLASVLSEEAAMAEWKRISGKNKDLLGALTPAVTKADLGDRGVFYRLRAGPLADKAAAVALCESLAAVNVGCLPAPNKP